ncbi:MAG: DUF2974 domain-containing protein [Solobacterium sp.]|nr:DUF2974 domain-containing protein [Solobacterium sp.]
MKKNIASDLMRKRKGTLMELNVLQYLLINNLMYMKPQNGPFPDLCDFEGRKLRTFMNSIDLSGWQDDSGNPPMTSAKEYRDIVQAIRNDPLLMDLMVKTVYTDTSEKGGNCRFALFTSSRTNEAVIAFEGTEMAPGSPQWKDNFASANVSDSIQQIKALLWYRSVYKHFHLETRQVILTGHSKGGNKAKYIAILDETPKRCLSFNSEGFSDKFFQRYEEKIRERQNRIENHIVNYDYVSLLLNDIGSETYYFGYNYGSGGFAETHIANTFLRFDEDGKPHMDIDENGRPVEMREFDAFCNSLLRSLDNERRTSILKTMNKVLDAILSLNRSMTMKETLSTILKIAEEESDRRNIAYFMAYMIRYEQANPEVTKHINTVLFLFDLEGISQYVKTAEQILNWEQDIFFMHFSFLTLSSVAAAIVRWMPEWLMKRLQADLEKRGIPLSRAQLKQLQMILIQTEADLRTLTLSAEKLDRTVPENIF